MADYVFPFHYVHELNDIFAIEKLPFDQFSTMQAFRNDISTTDAFNSLDDIDREIINETHVETSYYDIESFTKQVGFDKFSFLFLNINSLSKHYDDFSLSILNKNYAPKIIAFCETKLSLDIEHLYNFSSYKSIFSSNNSRSGGLALFISDEFQANYKILHEHCFMYDYIESLCVEFEMNNDSYNFLG